MASSSDTMDHPIPSSRGIRIRNKEDLDRVISNVRMKEAELKSVQNRLKAREVKVMEAEQRLAKRNEFLDAWEVSLKSKESKILDEREELEALKRNLKDIGQQMLSLAERTDPTFEAFPFEDDVLEDFSEDEAPADKKPILGFLKNKPKKKEKESPKQKSRGKKQSSRSGRVSPPSRRKTLRDALAEKRDRLRDAEFDGLDDVDDEPKDNSGLKELEELLQDEAFTCPTCEAEVSSDDDSCPSCGAELNWGT